MRVKNALLLAAFGAATLVTSSNAAVVYDSVAPDPFPANSVYNLQNAAGTQGPPLVLDDAKLAAGVPAANNDVLVDNIFLNFVALDTGTFPKDVRIFFSIYGPINRAGTTTVAGDPIDGFTVDLTVDSEGWWEYEIDISSLAGGGLLIPSNAFSFEYAMATVPAPGGNPSLNLEFTPIFYGSTITVGSTDPTSFIDDNLDFNYTLDEEFSFGTTPPDLTNAMVRLEGTEIPAVGTGELIQGTVNLGGYVGSTLPQVTVTVDGGTPQTVTLNPGSAANVGTFTISVPLGTTSASVRVKPDGFLSQTQTVTITPGTTAEVLFDNNGVGLAGGDSDNNNVIDDFDLFDLTNDFLLTPTPGKFTDVDGNGTVDDFDLFILTGNFLFSGN